MLTQFLALGTLAILIATPAEWKSLASPDILIACIIAGAPGGCFVNYAEFLALRTLEISRYTILTAFKPVLVAGLAVLLLGEQMNQQQLVSGLIMVIGSLLLTKRVAFVKPKPI